MGPRRAPKNAREKCEIEQANPATQGTSKADQLWGLTESAELGDAARPLSALWDPETRWIDAEHMVDARPSMTQTSLPGGRTRPV
jgi:hypothetical protein